MNKNMNNLIKKYKKEKVVKQTANKSFKSFGERNQLSSGYLMKKKIGLISFQIIRAIMLFGLCFLILQPILNKISVSFMLERDLYDATVINVPRNWTLDNYALANELMGFTKAFGTTLWISLLVAIIQVASTTVVGYGFARYKFPFRSLLFGAVILSIVIPPQTILTALYLRFRYFDVFGIIELITGNTVNLLSSIWPYLLISAGAMGLKNGLYIYMLRQYFRGIPKELEEAAYVDGCGKLKTFLVIMLPDAKPMLTSIFLFSFVWQWTDTFYSSLFLGKYKLVANALGGLADRLAQHVASISNNSLIPSIGYQQAMISTGTLMVIAPLIIIYLIAQKGFVESLAQSGIKM